MMPHLPSDSAFNSVHCLQVCVLNYSSVEVDQTNKGSSSLLRSYINMWKILTVLWSTLELAKLRCKYQYSHSSLLPFFTKGCQLTVESVSPLAEDTQGSRFTDTCHFSKSGLIRCLVLSSGLAFKMAGFIINCFHLCWRKLEMFFPMIAVGISPTIPLPAGSQKTRELFLLCGWAQEWSHPGHWPPPHSRNWPECQVSCQLWQQENPSGSISLQGRTIQCNPLLLQRWTAW